MVIIITIIAYFGFLLAFSRVTSRRATNDTFYRADRRSPWYMVAFGMIGASISGVTFVSVPGMVIKSDMTYLQMCLGFIFGYAIVAFVLLPVYYRMNLTTIYSYLQTRLGRQAYKTGASFFLLSKLGRSFPPDCVDYGGFDMALYPQRRHKNPRLDRCFSDGLHAFSPLVDWFSRHVGLRYESRSSHSGHHKRQS